MVNLLLSKESTVADVLRELAADVGPQSDSAMAVGDDGGGGGVVRGRGEGGGRMLDPSKLRMMEVFNHRIYKIFQVRIPSQIPSYAN